jgi:hypothetical protein
MTATFSDMNCAIGAIAALTGSNANEVIAGIAAAAQGDCFGTPRRPRLRPRARCCVGHRGRCARRPADHRRHRASGTAMSDIASDVEPLFAGCDDDDARRSRVESALLHAVQERLIDCSCLPVGVTTQALNDIVFASPTFKAFTRHYGDVLIGAERAGVEAQVVAAVIKARGTPPSRQKKFLRRGSALAVGAPPGFCVRSGPSASGTGPDLPFLSWNQRGSPQPSQSRRNSASSSSMPVNSSMVLSTGLWPPKLLKIVGSGPEVLSRSASRYAAFSSGAFASHSALRAATLSARNLASSARRCPSS